MPNPTTVTRTRRTQQERRESTRKALIEAALQVIKQEGYAAASTRRVAAAAGVSLGAMNYHFATRHDMVAAAFDDVFQRTTVEFEAEITRLRDAGEDRIGGFLDSFWEIWRSDLFTVWAQLWVAATGDPELYDVLSPVEQRLTEAMRSIMVGLAPADLPPKLWLRRVSLATDAMRGLALLQHFEPTAGVRRRDRWPDTRAELIELLSRRN
ncbi:TetR/AcrR family transcriptional regulator [Nocardia sp. 2]|uniref:TetR/AcrR family transcriptional regulator n=1 Tax=Nocardia acididurans TaxID=2802282 RepID=A0ABS1M039_9NOCA|nr:TetR/AcrR family transcriptional regulator [Nocardia acididurans]MBL1073410.1 TetR/AcrR family transcriptional regulator [Nocardia acididurans]